MRGVRTSLKAAQAAFVNIAQSFSSRAVAAGLKLWASDTKPACVGLPDYFSIFISYFSY